MKKTIIKTVFITLACIIVLAVSLFGILTLFTPKTMGAVADSFGNNKVAVYFYKMQYEKTNNNDDLIKLVIKLEESDKRTEEYSLKVIDKIEKGEIVFDADKRLSEKEYYYTKYLLATINSNQMAEGLKKAKSFVLEEGYSKGNPFRVVVYQKYSSLSEEDKTLFKNTLNAVRDALEDRTLIDTDIASLN